MLLIIIWYFFHNYFWPRPWPQPLEIGLGLGLEVLASFNITVKSTVRDDRVPVSLQIHLVAYHCDGNVFAGDALVLSDRIKVRSCLVVTRTTRNAVDDDERVCPLEIAVWTLPLTVLHVRRKQ